MTDKSNWKWCELCEGDKAREPTQLDPGWTFKSYDGFVVWVNDENEFCHRHNTDYQPDLSKKISESSSRLGDVLCELDKEPDNEDLREEARHLVLRSLAATIESQKGVAALEGIRGLQDTLKFVFQPKKQAVPPSGSKCPLCKCIVGGQNIQVNISESIAGKYLFCQTCPHFEGVEPS